MIFFTKVQCLDFYSNPYSFPDPSNPDKLLEGVTFYIEVYDQDAPSGKGNFIKFKVDKKYIEANALDDPEKARMFKGKNVNIGVNLSMYQGNTTVKVVSVTLDK